MANGEIYGRWASVYEAFEEEASIDTWRQGIIRELVALAPKTARILDIGAGTGIGRREILRQLPDATVFCLDRSADMLEIGGAPAELRIVADMADFTLAGEDFDFVVCGFDALNYLHRYDLLRCLECVAAALRPGGRLIFDYSSRRLLREDWGFLDVARPRGRATLKSSHRYDPVLDRTTVWLSYWEDGEETWREVHRHYAIDPSDLYVLARHAGLEVLTARDIDKDTFSPAGATHVWVLERPAMDRDDDG